MDDWDSLLNPYEESIQKGSKEGIEAGLKAGFDDGYHLGRVKALEIGFELGYMHSVASNALETLSNLNNSSNNKDGDGGGDGDNDVNNDDTGNTNSNSNHDRRITRLKEFIDLIQAFYSPDELFSTKKNPILNPIQDQEYVDGGGAADTHDAHEDAHEHPHEDGEEKNPINAHNKSLTQTPIDVTQKMQRIRAKFKTIVVQIKMPHLPLQKIMNGGTLGVGAVGVGVGVGAGGAASLPLAFGSTSQGGVVKNHRINKSRGADAAAVVHDNEW
jgi:hypothetical protein